MNFIDHHQLTGKHALLSASKYSWLRYTDERLDEVVANMQDAANGSKLHEFARQAITLGIRLPRTAKTLNQYVNDCLGFRMTPEQVLYYSDNIFGTADAISFRRERGMTNMMLRISDLKTGVTKASMDQLLIYTAIFCLEYQVDPATIDIELRLYQNDEVIPYIPTLEDIVDIMAIIVRFDKRINQLKAQAEE